MNRNGCGIDGGDGGGSRKQSEDCGQNNEELCDKKMTVKTCEGQLQKMCTLTLVFSDSKCKYES